MTEPIIQTSNLSNTFQALRSRDPNKIRLQKVEEHPDYKRIPNSNYAPIAMAHTGALGGNFVRQASANTGVIYGQPQFFSPVHSPINWQIPSKRIEQYQWARFFYENEPKVASAIDFYSEFPMSDWDHECKDRKVKNYFDNFKKRLDLNKWTRLISHEIHLLGDCFPLVEIDCPHCHGTGKLGSEVCDHEGGTVKRIVILNPDFVEVHSSPMNPDPLIALRPDQELINMVQRKTPGYEKLHPDVIKLIASGQPIRLDNNNISHLKYGECGYNKYGVGMVRRLFPILSYKTKLMVAQWIVAERLIVPIKIVKVGSDERPAGPADIAAVQAQLAQTANDPNMTIITHHAFDLDWVGASGKILTISNEFEFVNQEILDGLMINNALLNGEGPCYHPSVEILTEQGWKTYDQVEDDEKLATFNVCSGKLEYQDYTDKIIRNYKGDMVCFNTNNIDMIVTPNHRMFLQERTTKNKKDTYGNWKLINAQDVKYKSKMRACVDDWEGIIPSQYVDGITVGKHQVKDIKSFVEFIGYYLSEGYCNKKSCGMCQNSKSYVTNKIRDCLNNMGIHFLEHKETNSFNEVTRFRFSQDIGDFIRETMNVESNEKFIPLWIKNLPKEFLWILLQSLVDGDGAIHKNSSGNDPYIMYPTVSKQLADDVQEIAIKLGFSTTISSCDAHDKNQKQYIVSISNSDIGRFPVLDTIKFGNKSSDNRKCISNVSYDGKVWCYNVPNETLIVRRNGKILICGNSFGNASVGIEAMIQRLKTFRQQISQWIERFIYLPEAKRQGFVEKNEDTGEEEYIVPTIKWHKMHLRDEQQNRQSVMQLYEKGLLSAQTVLETFEYDPDQEIERKRYDAIQMMALGQGQAGQGGMGGAGGGMGGGGMGGGLPDMGGMGGLGGEAPPDMGGGGMGGEAPISAPGGDAGAGPIVAKSTSLSSETVDPSLFGGKILKKKNREKILSDQQKIFKKQQADQKAKQQAAMGVNGGQTRDEKGRIIFTKPERQLISLIMQHQKDGIIKYSVQPQFRVTSGSSEFPIDFAIPNLKLGLEADGEVFHSSPSQKQKDQERDMKLAQQGWTIIRFSDAEIEKRPQQVMATIVQEIMKKEMMIKNQMAQYKKAEADEEIKISSDIHEELEKINNSFVEESPNSNN